tara:strand:+ start:3557 stop:5134 length:1578 start_codon:yes stop_codon:yes gene_type:complete
MPYIDDDKLIYNIRELPEAFSITSGDLLVVEDTEGTKTIDFNNIIIGLDNTTFGTTITQNATDIVAISAAEIADANSPRPVITDNSTITASLTGNGLAESPLGIPQIRVPSPTVHIVRDDVYNTDGRYQELGTSERPFVVRTTTDLRTIIAGLPSGRHVKLGPGVYQVDDGASPGNMFAGVELNKDMIFEGAGKGASIIQFKENIPGPIASGLRQLINISGGSTQAEQTDVTVSNLTLDANFAASLTPGCRSGHGCIGAGNERLTIEHVECIKFGRESHHQETFPMFLVRRNAINGYVMQLYVNDVEMHTEEQGTDNDKGMATLLVGSETNVASQGDCRGVVRGFRTTRTGTGVGLGMVGTSKMLFDDCYVDTSIQPQGYPFLHDTLSASNVTIQNSYFKGGSQSYPIVFGGSSAGTSPCDNMIIKGNVIEKTNAQLQNVLLTRSNGSVIISNNHFIGTTTDPSYTYAILGIGTPIPTAFTALVHDNMVSLSGSDTIGRTSTAIPGVKGHNNYFLETGGVVPLTE